MNDTSVLSPTCVVLWLKEAQRTHKICELGVKFSLLTEIKQLLIRLCRLTSNFNL